MFPNLPWVKIFVTTCIEPRLISRNSELSESRLTGLAGHQAPPLVSECNLKRKERTKLDSTKPDRQTDREAERQRHRETGRRN